MSHEPQLDPADEAAVSAYLAGDLADEERAAFERRLVREPDLAEAVYAQRDTSDLLHRRGERHGLRWGAIGGLLAAAAVAAAVLVGRPGDPARDGGPVFRGDADPAAPTPVTATGVLDAWPGAFAWRAVPGAVRYRFVLRDAAARTLLDTVVADTSLAGAVAGPPRRRPDAGHWRVTPILAGDREGAPGPLVTFEVDRR